MQTNHKREVEERVRSRPKIGERARQLLAEGHGGRRLTYKEIAAKIREEYEEAATTVDSVSWYASQMRRDPDGPWPNAVLAKRRGPKGRDGADEEEEVSH